MGEGADPDPEMTSRQRREANLGVVLISISILFIACQSVKIIPDVYEVSERVFWVVIRQYFSCHLIISLSVPPLVLTFGERTDADVPSAPHSGL